MPRTSFRSEKSTPPRIFRSQNAFFQSIPILLWSTASRKVREMAPLTISKRYGHLWTPAGMWKAKADGMDFDFLLLLFALVDSELRHLRNVYKLITGCVSLQLVLDKKIVRKIVFATANMCNCVNFANHSTLVRVCCLKNTSESANGKKRVVIFVSNLASWSTLWLDFCTWCYCPSYILNVSQIHSCVPLVCPYNFHDVAAHQATRIHH